MQLFAPSEYEDIDSKGQVIRHISSSLRSRNYTNGSEQYAEDSTTCRTSKGRMQTDLVVTVCQHTNKIIASLDQRYNQSIKNSASYWRKSSHVLGRIVSRVFNIHVRVSCDIGSNHVS